MKYQSSIDQPANFPRVWGVEDPSLVDLSDEFTAIELFVDNPNSGFYHDFRYILETAFQGVCVVTEGILLGQSQSPDRPRLRLWSGEFDDLTVLSCINLGVDLSELDDDTGEMLQTSNTVNDDPIVFLNFDPETTTARFITSLDCVPELVRERHLGYLPKSSTAL